MSRLRALLVGLLLAAVLPGPPAPAAAGEPGGRGWIQAEYLLWWMKDGPAPVPLVSTDLIGAPGTRVLLGGDDLDPGGRHGARLTLGGWLTPDRRWGLEAAYFILPTATESRSVHDPGTGTLLVPFFDVTLPGESSTFLSLAGEFAGTGVEKLDSRLQGAELNGLVRLAGSERWRVDALAGVRWVNLSETYAFLTSSPDLDPPDVFMTRDVFAARNHFVGGQLGLRGEWTSGSWVLAGGARLGLGVMRQQVDIDGILITDIFSAGGEVERIPGGYFAQPTSMGDRTRHVFAVVPEVNVSLGYRLTAWMTVALGYTFLYASNVARPGDQVDRGINPSQSPSFENDPPPNPLVGPARPALDIEGSGFWAHGLNVAVILRY